MWDETTVTLDLGDEDEGEKKLAFLTVEYQAGRKEMLRGDPDAWAPPEPVDIHIKSGYWENNKAIPAKELRDIQRTYWEQIVEEIFP